MAERGGEGMGGGPGGKVRGPGWTGIRRDVCLSVCLLRVELVRAALANRHEIFGGGQGHGQERLSPEPAQSVKVGVRKRREIQILVISPLKMAIVLAIFRHCMACR